MQLNFSFTKCTFQLRSIFIQNITIERMTSKRFSYFYFEIFIQRDKQLIFSEWLWTILVLLQNLFQRVNPVFHNLIGKSLNSFLNSLYQLVFLNIFLFQQSLRTNINVSIVFRFLRKYTNFLRILCINEIFFYVTTLQKIVQSLENLNPRNSQLLWQGAITLRSIKN